MAKQQIAEADMAAGAEHWEMRDCRKQREAQDFWNLKSLPSVAYFLEKGHAFIVYSNSAANWGPRIQISEFVGAHSHSNHDSSHSLCLFVGSSLKSEEASFWPSLKRPLQFSTFLCEEFQLILGYYTPFNNN